MIRVAVLTRNITEKVLEFMNTLLVKPNDKTFEAYLDAVDTSKSSQVNLVWKNVMLESLFKAWKSSIKEASCSHESGMCIISIAWGVSRTSSHSQLGIKTLC